MFGFSEVGVNVPYRIALKSPNFTDFMRFARIFHKRFTFSTPCMLTILIFDKKLLTRFFTSYTE